MAVVYLLLNAVYETPFGGDSPGPRFLVATLPFLALGLAPAYRRLPVTTVALAVCSAVEMVALTLTDPILVQDHGWFHRFASGTFVETTPGLAGLPHVAVPLFFVALASAAGLAAVASARPGWSRRDLVRGPLAAAGWVVVVLWAPRVLSHDGSWAALGIVATVVVTAMVLPELVPNGVAVPPAAPTAS